MSIGSIDASETKRKEVDCVDDVCYKGSDEEEYKWYLARDEGGSREAKRPNSQVREVFCPRTGAEASKHRALRETQQKKLTRQHLYM